MKVNDQQLGRPGILYCETYTNILAVPYPIEGMQAWDMTGHKLYGYNGSAWVATGDVVGPASAVDGHLAVFDTTTGKLIKDGGAVPVSGISTVLPSGQILVGNASNVATPVTMTGDGSVSNTGVLSVNKTRLNVRNETGVTIATTRAVYTTGFNNLPLILLASNVDETKHNVIGLTVGSIAHEANGYIATNGQCDAETNGWTVGTELYLSTAGALVSAEPTSGPVIHVGIVTVQQNYPTGKILLYNLPEGNIMGAGSGQDLILRLGDTIAGNKVSVRNYSNAEVASVSSTGAITGSNLSGTNTGDNAGVTAVSGTSPVVSSGGNTPAISIPAATNVVPGHMTAAQVTALEANNAKVSNATHTGDVTGSTALTIANAAVTLAKMANIATSRVIGRMTAGAGVPEELTGANIRTLLGTLNADQLQGNAAAAFAAATHNQAGDTITSTVGSASAANYLTVASKRTHSVAQAIATTTWTRLSIDTLRFQSSANWYSRANSLTAPETGTYLVGASLEFAFNATGFRYGAITVNSGGAYGGTTLRATVGGGPAPTSSGYTMPVPLVALIYLSVNDYLELWAFQSSGGNLNVTKAEQFSPELWAIRLY